MPASRVVMFFDWQNIYRRAREAFGDDEHDPSPKGQVDPMDLALVLLDKHRQQCGDAGADLAQVRIYRGRPTQQHDAKGYAAFQRQAARWSNNKIRAHFNDLRYPADWGEPGCDAPREKGIDVALAVDLVVMASGNEFDTAIVMSADYDLVPAIEHIVRRRLTRGDGPKVEVAAWKSDLGGKPLRIRLHNNPLWCHWLERQDYWGVEDTTDYNIKQDRDQSAGPVPSPPRRF